MELLENNGDIENICATVMPDHVHWLFVLGARLPLGRIVSKWKHLCPNKIEWQRDFFDHRLRPEEEVELYGRYIFMNPYRVKLAKNDEVHSGTRIWKPELFVFLGSLTPKRCPQPEWLAQTDPAVDLWQEWLNEHSLVIEEGKYRLAEEFGG
ncbi:MAG: transposase, partial [Coraliomargarita sp.]